MPTNKAVMDLDKNLMTAYLREREAFGWAMSADAASRDHQHASETWTEYAHTALAARQEVEGITFEVSVPTKGKTEADECIVTVVVNGRHFSVGDEVTALGFPGVIRGFYHDGRVWRAEVDMKNPEKVLGHPNPAHPSVVNLRPNGPSKADIADMAKALGVGDEAWLAKRVKVLEKELEATTAALCSTKDDLIKARQVIQALLITATCTDLPTADAAAVRQAVAFLGGTSE